MRKSIYKLFWAWEFDKEEEWLNQMAAIGLALEAVGGFKYTFTECLPGEYGVRAELLENWPSHAESQQYIRFLEDTGAEYLGSNMRWAYFRKKTEKGAFDLFSDNSSRIRHLNRILALLSVVTIMELIAAISYLVAFFLTGEGYMLGACIPIFIFGAAVGYGTLRLYLKKRRLLREGRLFE